MPPPDGFSTVVPGSEPAAELRHRAAEEERRRRRPTTAEVWRVAAPQATLAPINIAALPLCGCQDAAPGLFLFQRSFSSIPENGGTRHAGPVKVSPFGHSDADVN